MTPAGIVAWLTKLPARTGLFTDFDGTLAPIVSDPVTAAPVAGVVASLHLLAGHLAAVAVVSGRPARFLADQLALGAAPAPIHAYGLHGLEHTTGAEVEVAPTAVAWKPALETARDEALRDAPAGVVVEDKGFGVTLHWRNAGNPGVEAAGRALGEHLAARHALVARPGRASIELVPPIGIDKGTVLLEWGERLASLGSAGVASAGVGSAGVGSAGVASAGVGSAGVGSAGVGSAGVASAGVGSAGVGSAGVASAGVGSAGVEPLPRLAFFGDDVGDEIGFEALASLAESGRAEVLRAAVTSTEGPAILFENADVVLASPSEVAAVLAGAAEELGRSDLT